MGKIVIIVICVIVAVLLAGLFFTVIIPSMQYGEIRKMEINNVDLNTMEDGVYGGTFAYSQTEYKVEVKISDHQIDSIDILSGGKSEYAKSAEQIVDTIIREQQIDVDVVSGATTSSKAILKAVENALTGGK